MRKSPNFSPDIVERAVRTVFETKDQYESRWAAIESIAAKIGCAELAVRLDPLQRAAGRDHQWPIQGRADPQQRAMEDTRSRWARHARMGVVVHTILA